MRSALPAVASFADNHYSVERRLTTLQLAENLRLLRECRCANLSTLESLEALGQLSAPQVAGDAASDDADPAPASAGSEHDGADSSRAAQRAVLSALRLTQEQIAAVLEVG